MDNFVMWPEVQRLTGGKHRVTVRRWIARGIFPQEVEIGPGSIGWRRSDLEAWHKDPAGWSDLNEKSLEYKDMWGDVVLSEHGPKKSTTRAVLIPLAIYAGGDARAPILDFGKAQWEKVTHLKWPTIHKHLLLAEREGWLEIVRGKSVSYLLKLPQKG